MTLWRIKYNIRSWFRTKRNNFITWFIWRLPRSWMYWAVIRVWAYGTTGKYGTTAPDDLSWNEALNRWNTSNDIEGSTNG